MTVEHADAVVVGARCAGSATAIALARAGRRVVVLDRARFPSDTLSTHLLFPAGVAELDALGVLARVRALGAPPLREAMVGGAGLEARAPFTPVAGIDHGLCVRRTGLDAALVAGARAAGADVREGVRVTGLVHRAGRVAGVRYEDRRGGGGELHAPLVAGADGRRSTVARLVGAARPYRANANGRACYYAYVEDAARDGEPARHLAAQWRQDAELATAFPCDGGLVLVLLMPPVGRAGAFRADLAGEYRRTVGAIGGLRERLGGGAIVTKVRSATDTTSYFRRSSGPGWALPGDAGHFKDPVTAQGIRDALRFGRLLGEAAAPVLDDATALDRVLLAWERRREAECLETYQWTNVLGRGEPMTPLEVELYREIAADPARTRELLDVFSRLRSPSAMLAPARALRLTARALARPGARRGDVLRVAAREVRTAGRDALERARARRAALPALAVPEGPAAPGPAEPGAARPRPLTRA